MTFAFVLVRIGFPRLIKTYYNDPSVHVRLEYYTLSLFLFYVVAYRHFSMLVSCIPANLY